MTDKPLTDIAFSSFELHPDLLSGLEGAGFTRCTPIQAMTLPITTAGRVSRRFTTVTRNASVLPVPVWAWPATSRPAVVIGRVIAWIGVQRVNPAPSSPDSRSGCRANEEKAISVSGLSDMRGLQNSVVRGAAPGARLRVRRQRSRLPFGARGCAMRWRPAGNIPV